MTPWHEETLGEFVSLQRGHDLPTDSRGEGVVPVVGSFGITGYHDKARAQGPGVTVGRSGASAGTVFFINEDFWPHNTCLFVTDFHGNHPRFAYYLLSTLDLPSHAAGSAQPSLNRNHILPLPVRVPERTEQDRIVHVLSALDDKIALNRRTNEILEALAQAIFKDWFVNFGPVRRKLEGATDPVAVLGGVIPHPAKAAPIAALFPDGLGDDGLPRGWDERPFSDYVDIIGGGTPRTSEPGYWNGDIPWFSVVDTPSGSDTFVFQTEKNITPQGLSGSSTRLISPGTTIITARGTVGNLAIAGREMAFNQSCYALRSPRDLHPFFTYLASKQLVERLKSMAHGSVFSTITRQTFENVSLPNSSIAIRDAFEDLSAPLFDRISASVQESRTLAETRDYLLPKLMSGEVRVRDAQNAVSG